MISRIIVILFSSKPLKKPQTTYNLGIQIQLIQNQICSSFYQKQDSGAHFGAACVTSLIWDLTPYWNSISEDTAKRKRHMSSLNVEYVEKSLEVSTLSSFIPIFIIKNMDHWWQEWFPKRDKKGGLISRKVVLLMTNHLPQEKRIIQPNISKKAIKPCKEQRLRALLGFRKKYRFHVFSGKGRVFLSSFLIANWWSFLLQRFLLEWR